jgi:hypothetical protein
VEQIDEADVDRHPRRVEQAEDLRAGEKAAQLVEVAQGLGAAATAEGADEHEARQLRVEARPEAHQQPRAHHLEGRQRGQAGRGKG